ncbi:ATP-binding protein [Candidatus Woesearchaeota archaeon]|nr:ATP-binding protein [Candidatus Woesearchaeota archaeon]
MTWYEKHGYNEDPFSTRKGVFIEKAVNLTEPAEELAYHIGAGNIILVEGEKGTGKTALVFAAMERFKGEGRLIYFDCSKDKVNLKKLLQNRHGIFGKVLNILPKNMVLLLDNFRELPMQEIERAKYYYDNNYLRSIVFVGNGTSTLPANIMDRIGNRVIRLKKLTDNDAIQLVKNRLGSLELLPEKTIRKIYRKSSGDANKFLENCSKALEEGEKNLNTTGEPNE